jgi:heme-degrading monooxygenase HmoA
MRARHAAGCRQNEIRTMIHQIRIYEIFENNKAAFHARFRDHAARIMKTYGFQIVAMWDTRAAETTQFVYLLEWPDEATKTAAWAAFMQDKEWAEIKRVTSAEHGALVGDIEDRILMPLDYSPAAGRSLLKG